MSRFYNRRADLRCYIHDLNLRTLTIMAACLILSIGISAQTTKKGTARMTLASGPFDVKTNPQSEDKGEGSSMGRLSLDKQYHGDLEATAQGEMLYASSTAVQGSGSYVAVERVTGKLHGKSGSFTLAHKGSMSGGTQQMDITIVPDSGAGELAGISGTVKIIITAAGKHSYELEYTLP
jgi:hypothetical protein